MKFTNLCATKLNHKLPMYVSPVPDCQALETDALNISWEGLDGYVFCSVALIPQVIQKMTTYRCKIIMIAPGWPGMSSGFFLSFLSSGCVHESPSKTSLVVESVGSAIQQQALQQSCISETSCLASGVNHEYSGRFSEEVAKRIKEPQRGSSSRIYESRWNILGKWYEQSQLGISNPTVPEVVNFLNLLFKEKNLKQQLQMG